MKKLLLSCSLLGIFAATNAQVASLNENFEGATGIYLPYNDWKSDLEYPDARIYTLNSNKLVLLKAPSSSLTGDPIFLFSPELISVEGTLRFTFGGVMARSGGTLRVGTISKSPYSYYGDAFDESTFKVIKELTLPKNKLIDSGEIQIPADTNKHIAFEYVGENKGYFMGLDNIVFTPKSLSTTENAKEKSSHFAVGNDALVFTGKDVRSVQIYNANGSLVLNEKVSQNRVSISKLGTGVYFIIIEDKSGKVEKSKFVKK